MGPETGAHHRCCYLLMMRMVMMVMMMMMTTMFTMMTMMLTSDDDSHAGYTVLAIYYGHERHRSTARVYEPISQAKAMFGEPLLHK